jgi:hypothetical protein
MYEMMINNVRAEYDNTCFNNDEIYIGNIVNVRHRDAKGFYMGIVKVIENPLISKFEENTGLQFVYQTVSVALDEKDYLLSKLDEYNIHVYLSEEVECFNEFLAHCVI